MTTDFDNVLQEQDIVTMSGNLGITFIDGQLHLVYDVPKFSCALPLTDKEIDRLIIVLTEYRAWKDKK